MNRMGLRALIAVSGVGLVLAVSHGAFAQGAAGPRLRADGPDADRYGRQDGYPACRTFFREQRCLVGAHSRFDALFPARTIAAPSTSVPLGRAPAEPAITYEFLGDRGTLDSYLDRNPVTGLLVAKGHTIVIERYQYGRTDRDRFTSFSMAKTITALLIGIAVADGTIRSIDDPAETYVPGLKGSEYGRTPIKALLQMSSGVAFSERYDGADDVTTLARLTLGQDPGGSLAALRRFNTRIALPGERYAYASAETLVLGLVLTHATRGTVADYARRKLWEPLGAEAEATWTVDATGQEITFAYFNAVLRDWGRLGLMLAHDGAWHGRTVVPAEWLRAATTVAPGDDRLGPSGRAGFFGYGYQTWIAPGPRRVFALRGVRGQVMLVDPDLKLVLVQTAVYTRPIDSLGTRELLALWEAVSSHVR